MAEHKHGSMNIEAQEKTFNGFINLVVKTAVAIAVVLVFLAIART